MERCLDRDGIGTVNWSFGVYVIEAIIIGHYPQALLIPVLYILKQSEGKYRLNLCCSPA